MCRSFPVKRHRCRADFRVSRRPVIGILDHQVNIERQGTHLSDALHDWQAESQIGDEVAVHDVHVKQVRVTHERDVPFEIGEVGRKYRGRDASCHEAKLSRSPRPYGLVSSEMNMASVPWT